MKFSLKSKGDYKQWCISVDEYPFFGLEAARGLFQTLMSQPLWIRELKIIFFYSHAWWRCSSPYNADRCKGLWEFHKDKIFIKQEGAYEVIEIHKVSTQLQTYSGI